MRLLTFAVTLAAFLSVCGAARAEPAPQFFVDPDGFVCPEMDSLTGKSVEYKLSQGRCFSGLVQPTPIVVLDADYPFAYVCALFRGTNVVVDGKRGKRNAVMCGYALQRDLRDARGYDQGFKDVEQAAHRSSMADVHRLP